MLGADLRITDEEQAINQLKSDIKYAHVSQYQDLIFELIEVGDHLSDPDLFIMLSDERPASQKHDLMCSFYGEDICVLSGRELSEHNVTKITVGVRCTQFCEFKLQAELEAEIELKPNKMHKIYFQKDQQRIMRFEVPDSEDIYYIDFKGIADDAFGQFEMLIINGNKVPDTSQALILAPAWENGYVAKFERNCHCFCTGCNYTLLVSSKSEGYINIGGKLSESLVNLNQYPGGVLYDVVRAWDLECYSYKVSDPEKDLILSVQEYSGQVAILINPLGPPTR